MTRRNVIDSNFNDFKSYLSRMISHRSVLSDDALPFGKNIDEALNEILEISKELGFNTFKDSDGYYGYAEIGEGAPLIGILCHIDVVNEGDLKDWKSNPFELTERDGLLIGRGTSDDKGPTLMAMLALKYLLDEGHKLNSRVRFIFGTDEENLWRCLDAYKEKEEIPSLGFAPDADFPLVNVEKGLMQIFINAPLEENRIITGGNSLNAVASHASTKVREGLIETLKSMDVRFEVEEDTVKVFGVSAHASTPDKGINAIYLLSKALKESGTSTAAECFVADLYDNNPLSKYEDTMSGKLTFNVGMAYTDHSNQIITVDIRYPVSFSLEEVSNEVIDMAAEYGMRGEIYSSISSLYIPEDSELVTSLMESYKEVTGDVDAQPLKIGGATYARAIPNTVAFGPGFPGSVGSAHEANEFINIEETKKAIEIYMNAFERIT